MSDRIKEWLEKHAIDEVEGIVPDMAGVARGKFVPAGKFLKEEGMRIPESIFIQTVTGQYIEEPEMLHPGDRDMVLLPDESTMRPVPWAVDPTASVIMDCFHHDGTPVAIAPRQVLKNVLALYEAEGWLPLVAPEVEFYLVKKNVDPDYPLEPPVGRSGRPETARQPYSIDAVNEFDPLFEDIYENCEGQGLEVDTLIHEGGAAQVEMNFLHGDALSRADQVFLFKRLVREAALRKDIYATFMAKPMAEEPGSSMHLHQSVVRKADGKNIFANDDGTDSKLFHAFIGGLQKYLPDCFLIFGPYVNSYRRFTRYLAAPINLHWGYDNRTVGLRVPQSGGQDRRVENRLAGADVNAYLTIAASLACGYLGIKQGLKPTAPVEGSAYELAGTFPRDIFSAIDRLQDSTAIQSVLGAEFATVFCALKAVEHNTFFQVISPWEREFLLLNV